MLISIIYNNLKAKYDLSRIYKFSNKSINANEKYSYYAYMNFQPIVFCLYQDHISITCNYKTTAKVNYSDPQLYIKINQIINKYAEAHPAAKPL